MKNKEQNVADTIANATEDHWFNPATVARILSDQPHYTIDRVMELVAWVIEKEARRHEEDWKHGNTSEGLFLAKELDKKIEELSKKYKWENIKLPPAVQKAAVKKIQKPRAQVFGYIEDKDPFA
jgi:hypothetical protein